MVFMYVSDREEQLTKQYGDLVPVVVASKNILEFEEIRRDMLKVAVVPKKFVQPGAHIPSKNGDAWDLATFEGSVASAPIQADEQVLGTKVLLKGADTGLASQVAVTYRALSLPISELTGVGKLIKPGDRVDLISNVFYQTEKGQESEVKTILQNVNILAVGEQIQNVIPTAYEDDAFTGGRIYKNKRNDRTFSFVTVEVSPSDAQLLVYMLGNGGGEIYYTLRNPIDRVVANIPSTTVEDVLGPDSKRALKERLRQMGRGGAAGAGQ